MSGLKSGLIQTKFFPLETGAKFLLRERLVEQISNSLEQAQIVTIIGAAGSGKSVLMSQLFEQIKTHRKTCWLNFEKDDNDPISFFSYFIAALQETDPDLGDGASKLINADLICNPETAFQSLCEDISKASAPIAIFLDDFQYITQAPILAGMSKFIEWLPRNVLLVLTSRSQLSIEVSRRRVNGSLVEIDQRDLSFSTQETQHFLSNMHNLTLDVTDAKSLAASTEGWAAGLQLAGLALKKAGGNKRDVIQQFSGSDRALNTYLMETVFGNQPEEVRTFLLKTAPLSRMNAEICSAVSGIEECEKLLEYLQRENMFLIPLDHKQQWFRYHHLFSEFLNQQLQKSDKKAFKETCEKASKWFAENDLNTEAIKYLLAAKHHDRAAELIAVEGVRVAQIMGDHQTILSWMQLLPAQYRDGYPQISLNYAWTLLFTRSAHRSEEIADEIKAELNRGESCKWNLTVGERQKLECQTDVIKAISYNARDDIAKASKLLQQSLTKWRGADSAQLSALYSSLAYTCIVNLELDKGFEAASKARVLSLQSGADYLCVWADWLSAVICIEKGLLNDADGYLNQGQVDADRLTGKQSHGRAMITLVKAELFCDRGDVEAAANELEKSGWLGTYFAPLEPLFMAYRTQARILAFRNNTAAAGALLKEGQELGLVSRLPRLSYSLAAEEIKLHLRLNAVEDAALIARNWGFREDEAQNASIEPREIPLSLRKEIQARLLIAEQKFGTALSILNGLMKQPLAKQHGRQIVKMRILRAEALWNLERKREAMRELATATAIAAPNNFRLPFLDAGMALVDILSAMNSQRVNNHENQLSNTIKFEQSLLASLTGRVIDAADASDEQIREGLLTNLTPREIEIIDLMSSGLNNMQVADTLFVTLPTVKWHMQNIFEKFTLRNRTAVIAKARQLKIII